MSQPRNQRLESEIQRVLAALIAREVKDPRVGNVTLTAVDVAPDLSAARVFFTPFASRHSPAEVQSGLTHAAGFLRGALGRRLKLRHAPRLEFVFDATVEEAARLTRLIDSAVAADRAGAGTGVPEEPEQATPGSSSGAAPEQGATPGRR